MKITFILPVAMMTGGTRVVTIYAKALQEMGHDVLCVSQPLPKKTLVEKLKLLLKGKPITYSKTLPSHFDTLNLKHIVLDVPRPVNNNDLPDADIVIATWWETAEWVNNLNKSKGEKVYFVQHHEVFENLPIHRVKATYKLPLKKIVIANWLKQLMMSEYGDTNVELVPNSVEHDKFFASDRTKQPVPTVGFMFSFTAFKGVATTLSAIRKIKKSIPNLRVISFGTKPPINYEGWEQDIEFHQNPSQETIRTIYASCDVWLTASTSEGFNLPAMEAMACRTPVVSTKTGWPEEAIVNGTNGYLVDVNDANSLADFAISILNTSSMDWKIMSENAFATVSNSSWEKSAKQFEAILKNLLSGK